MNISSPEDKTKTLGGVPPIVVATITGFTGSYTN
jgi:hypothetical protein